jgi:hypothetical protein
MSDKSDKSESSFKFEKVLEEELDLLRGAREKDEKNPTYDRAHKANLVGIALSGGGIRSATFNLGVIQALTKSREEDHEYPEKGLLQNFDYLSTVSGGGYIGSWLSAWIHREAKDSGTPAKSDFLEKIQHKFSTRPCGFGPQDDSRSQDCKKSSGYPQSPENCGFPPLEHAAIRYLRRYSNYLTPKVGLSGDTLALISVFLRNLVLLQIALISFVATVILVPYVAIWIERQLFKATSSQGTFAFFIADSILEVGLLVLLITLAVCSSSLTKLRNGIAGGQTIKPLSRTQKSAVFRRNILLVTASIVACYAIVISAPKVDGIAPLPSYLAAGLILYAAAWIVGYFGSGMTTKSDGSGGTERSRRRYLLSVIVVVASGLEFALIAYLAAHILHSDWIQSPANTWEIITFGPPVLMLVISFIVALNIGTARAHFSEMEREWWSRLGGYALLASAIWLAVFATAIYGPPVVHWLGKGGYAVVFTWLGASGIGAWIARNASADMKQDEDSAIKRLFIRFAPFLFVAGLATLLSYLINEAMLSRFEEAPSWPNGISFGAAVFLSANEFRLIGDHDWLAPAALAVSSIFFTVYALLFDINIFSAHTMYKSRLVRAYLGASRAGRRRPHPFIGFDEQDDIPLEVLKDQHPIHIINATINMTGGDDLAWQTRRAASFAFTPRYVGYEAKSSQGIQLGGYRRTSLYCSGITSEEEVAASRNGNQSLDEQSCRGVTLGTAMAISGAAASPNMGHYTVPSVAALLTAFNMRLGYWAGNPSKPPEGIAETDWKAWRKKRPSFAAKPILSELTGSADAESAWINLSDGGHFDNLGIYELVRRRCRLIVVTDAGCDPDHEFTDLANAIRKCWTDLGVHVFFPELDLVGLHGKDRRYAKAHGSIGVIEYPDRIRGNCERYGLIVYLKCSLTKDDIEKFVDIRQYALKNPKFPHQSTGDQFFDENQFEAYRHLGYRVGRSFKNKIAKLFVDDETRLNDDMVCEKARKIEKQQ